MGGTGETAAWLDLAAGGLEKPLHGLIWDGRGLEKPLCGLMCGGWGVEKPLHDIMRRQTGGLEKPL